MVQDTIGISLCCSGSAVFLFSMDGMLVKRPLLIGDDFVLVGFKETEWESRLKTE